MRHHTAASGLLLVTQIRANFESFRSQLAKLLFCVPSRDFSNPNTQVRISKQECLLFLNGLIGHLRQRHTGSAPSLPVFKTH